MVRIQKTSWNTDFSPKKLVFLKLELVPQEEGWLELTLPQVTLTAFTFSSAVPARTVTQVSRK